MMASPWNFLTRLVSLRLRQKQDGDSIEDDKPDALTIAVSTETPVRENLTLVDQPTPDNAPPIIQSEPDSEPEPVAKAKIDLQATEESHRDGVAETAEPVFPDIGAALAYAAPKVEKTDKAVPIKRRGRAKKVEAVVVGSQTSPVVPTISSEMSLDQEIGVLREQLTSKLRLQNAQLKRMLERFDR